LILKRLTCAIGFWLLASAAWAQDVAPSKATAELTARIAASPVLPFTPSYFAVQPPTPGWETGMISWLAFDRSGLLYELQRGDKADPVLVLDRGGKLLRSWGRGNYTIPHSIRIDPAGNVWTVDAAASTVIKYAPTGEKLMTISVGEQPVTKSPFNGTTDIAFGPDGHLFITDGYGNARVLEYSADGQRLGQWGSHGTGPGAFHLPHGVQIDGDGTLYVADRENGRIERFDRTGRFLGEIAGLGRVYSIRLDGDAIWAGVQPLEQPTGSPGWVVKLDRKTGAILGHLDVAEAKGLHCIELSPAGEPVITLGDQLLWFKKKG